MDVEETKGFQRKLRKRDINDDKSNAAVDEEISIDSMDRISRLPDPLIQHILSFLPGDNAAAAAVLSRTWRRVQASCPALYFHQFFFTRKLWRRRKRLREKFVDFVDVSIQRFQKTGLKLQRFSLLMYDNLNDSPRIDHWIKFATGCNVRELYLCFWCSPYPLYVLPQTLFASKLLTDLTLSYCQLEDHIFSDSTTILDSLQRLNLEKVRLSENIISILISICPFITEFGLRCCSGVRNLRLSGLSKLKKVELREGYLETIEIKAPSLKAFHIHLRNAVACEIDLDSCESLEVLDLDCSILAESFCQDLCSSFPVLKALFLFLCDNLERLRISSPLLERLHLCYLANLVDATIDTPNLRSFKYSGPSMKLFSFSMDTPSLQETKLVFLESPRIDTSFFLKLRALVGKLSHNKVLSLRIPFRGTFHLEELRDSPIPPLCHVKHLKLKFLYSSSLIYQCVVDGVLWACHPETLTIIGERYNNYFIKALRGKLVNRIREQNCCKFAQIKCWLHYVKEIKIEEVARIYVKKSFVPRQQVSLKFRW